MKHLVLFLLMGTCVLTAAAQKIRLTDTSNRWTFEHQSGIFGEAIYDLYTYKMGADTTIGGKDYKKIQILSDKVRWDAAAGSHTGGTGKQYIGTYFREDTITNRVYCLTVGDSIERLIYDSSWQVGDSVAWGIGFQKGYNKVQARDSVFFNNAWYRLFRMSSGFVQFFIVEGIGTNKGTAFPTFSTYFENYPNLRCFSHEGLRPDLVLPGNAYDNIKSCAKTLQVAETYSAMPSINVTPNPGGWNMQMTIPAQLGSGRLRVIDMLGKTVLDFRFQAPQVLPIGHLLHTPGVYCYLVEDVTGKSYSGRFTSEN